MANINFLYRSKAKKESGAITLRLIHKDEIDIFINTGYISDKKFWFKSNGKQYPLPKGVVAKAKMQKQDLVNLELFIIGRFNSDYNNGELINKDWLQDKIDIYFNRKSEDENAISPYIVDNVDRIIKEAPYRQNQKGGIGLSRSRVNDFKAVKKFIGEFQDLNKTTYKVSDVDLSFKNKFISWFVEELGYDVSYGNRIIATLKTVCLDASYNGISTHPMLKKVTGKTKNNEYVIYLSFHELEKIKSIDLKRESLINARKWMLIGCSIGQRVGDLLEIKESDIVLRKGLKVIEFTQEKTDKNVTVPILPDFEAVIEQGFPYQISSQKLNKYVKEICQIAKIDKPTKGKLRNKNTGKYEIGEFPKYELISTHTFRRSFASNYYGIIPTPVLISITRHSSEQQFLNYIGKNSFDMAQQMAEWVQKIEQRTVSTPLKVVKHKKAQGE